MVHCLRLHEIIVRFLLRGLRLASDNEKARPARALFVENADQMWPCRRVRRNLDRKLSGVGLRIEHDSRGVHPHPRRPHINLADGSDRVGGADLDGDWIEVIERGRGGLCREVPRAKLKAQKKHQSLGRLCAVESNPRPFRKGEGTVRSGGTTLTE